MKCVSAIPNYLYPARDVQNPQISMFSPFPPSSLTDDPPWLFNPDPAASLKDIRGTSAPCPRLEGKGDAGGCNAAPLSPCSVLLPVGRCGGESLRAVPWYPRMEPAFCPVLLWGGLAGNQLGHHHRMNPSSCTQLAVAGVVCVCACCTHVFACNTALH